MHINDDRTEAQKKTHVVGVCGTDSFLSGWGAAQGGTSVACWACEPGERNRCESAVRSRSDMRRVRVVDLRDYRPGRDCAHFHIYVYDGQTFRQ